MNLSFSEKFNGEETFFLQQIWSGLIRSNPEDVEFSEMLENYKEYRNSYYEKFNKLWGYAAGRKKFHTIRKNQKGRWKVGNKIHFIINSRTPERFQFAPVLTLKKIQTVQVLYNGKGENVTVKIDGRLLHDEKIKRLALNDGFESVENFFKWFNEDYEGVILHWTNFVKY
jgi:hypothetical protein